MKRREFVTLIAGATAGLPFVARAQQPTLPVIGYLGAASPNTYAPMLARLRDGLHEAGFDEGRNVTIEYRWANGQYDLLPALAADLVRRRVAVLIVSASAAALAARAATTSIPIVFSVGEDPVTAGMVASMNRPGGNATGVYTLINGLEAKRLDLLRELVPQDKKIGAIVNPDRPGAEAQMKDLKEAAGALGQVVHFLNASSERNLETVFSSISQLRIEALLVGADVSYIIWREKFVSLAARYAIPTIYSSREFALSGGLMSYGPNLVEGYRQVGIYTGQIIRGAKPDDLPVVQSAKFELVINLKAAKQLALTIPPGIVAIADEVIE
jgi:putative tryptophan/tyrosine transport system substrate-binding protein